MTDDPEIERWLSASLFALAALCFLLPFATVSCDDARTTFTGMQLVTRTVPRGGALREGADCSSDISVCVERAAAPTATVALVAALAGVALGLLRIGRGPGWCALVGLGAIVALPFEGGWLGPKVTTHVGYDLALLLFASVWFLHVCSSGLGRRRGVRPLKGEVANA
jgi:hypothetical protein